MEGIPGKFSQVIKKEISFDTSSHNPMEHPPPE
jgi:hypothetical protein